MFHRAFVACMLSLMGIAPNLSAQPAANSLDKAPSKFAKLGKIRIHYMDIGTGKTALVFIHGWTCDLTHWRGQVPVILSCWRTRASSMRF